jgi:hypothetical protein
MRKVAFFSGGMAFYTGGAERNTKGVGPCAATGLSPAALSVVAAP